MKLGFNLVFFLLCWSSSLLARDLILVTYHPQGEIKALLIREILQQDLHFPDLLITLREENLPCRRNDDVLWHICVDEQENMKILLIRQKLLKRNFSIFQKDLPLLPRENQEDDVSHDRR
jgi:hypothetical protein